MAATTVNMPCGGPRDNELLEPRIPPLKTVLADRSEDSKYIFADVKWRCDPFCMQREPASEGFTPLYCWVRTQVQISLNPILAA